MNTVSYQVGQFFVAHRPVVSLYSARFYAIFNERLSESKHLARSDLPGGFYELLYSPCRDTDVTARTLLFIRG